MEPPRLEFTTHVWERGLPKVPFRLFLSPNDVALTPSRDRPGSVAAARLGWSLFAKQPITCASRCFKNGVTGRGGTGTSDEAWA